MMPQQHAPPAHLPRPPRTSADEAATCSRPGRADEIPGSSALPTVSYNVVTYHVGRDRFGLKNPPENCGYYIYLSLFLASSAKVSRFVAPGGTMTLGKFGRWGQRAARRRGSAIAASRYLKAIENVDCAQSSS